jgi:hypothetical protein
VPCPALVGTVADKAQCTMVASWLLDRHLPHIYHTCCAGGLAPQDRVDNTIPRSLPHTPHVKVPAVLQVLGPTDKAQSTMVAAWLTELLLDQINRDLLAAAGQHTSDYLQHVEQLRCVLRSVFGAGGLQEHLRVQFVCCNKHWACHIHLRLRRVSCIMCHVGPTPCLSISGPLVVRGNASCVLAMAQVVPDAVCCCVELEHHHHPA